MGRDETLPDQYDIAFPASEVPGQYIATTFKDRVVSTHTPFFSPIAVASFTPVMQILEANGVASQQQGYWTIDMAAYLELVGQETRWSDLEGSENYPSTRSVLFASTDIRSSNSAGMYMALASYVLNGKDVVSTREAAAAQLDPLAGLFIDQGYAQSSSSGPFERYLSRGAGEAPLVVIYEGQFLEEQLSETSRLRDDMVLAYPSPTIFSTHTAVTFSDDGQAVMQLLETDAGLAKLLAEHGFRANGQHSRAFDEMTAEAGLAEVYRPAGDFVDLAQLPSYEVMTYLLDEIGRRYELDAE